MGMVLSSSSSFTRGLLLHLAIGHDVHHTDRRDAAIGRGILFRLRERRIDSHDMPRCSIALFGSPGGDRGKLLDASKNIRRMA